MNVTNITSGGSTATPLEEIASYQAALLLPKVVLPVLVVLGVIGNQLTLATLHSRAYGPSTTTVALSLLAVADTGALLSNFRWWVKAVFAADFRLVSPAACRFHQMWTYYFRQLSSCTLAFITVERMTAVCFPIKWKTTFTKRGNYIYLGIMVLLLFGICLQLPFKFTILSYFEHNTEVLQCNVYYKDEDWYNHLWRPMDEAIHSFIPMITILAGNAVIVWRLRTSPDLSGGSDDRNASITVMLVAVSLVFILTTTPIAVFNVGDGHGAWRDVTDQQYADVTLAHVVTMLWTRVNNAVNFLLYCATGTKFRQAFVKTFLPKSNKIVFHSHRNSHGVWKTNTTEV